MDALWKCRPWWRTASQDHRTSASVSLDLQGFPHRPKGGSDNASSAHGRNSGSGIWWHTQPNTSPFPSQHSLLVTQELDALRSFVCAECRALQILTRHLNLHLSRTRKSWWQWEVNRQQRRTSSRERQNRTGCKVNQQAARQHLNRETFSNHARLTARESCAPVQYDALPSLHKSCWIWIDSRDALVLCWLPAHFVQTRHFWFHIS